MGKGDKKTKRGKISMGTYGVTRPHKVSGSTNQDTKASKPKKKTGKKKSAK